MNYNFISFFFNSVIYNIEIKYKQTARTRAPPASPRIERGAYRLRDIKKIKKIKITPLIYQFGLV